MLFSRSIITWYTQHKRKLPWRETKDPYIIWISEVILQQTRVEQGYDYYMRFIERFPNVKTLAEASEMEVLKYWQGLGYYSRARNLHAAAQHIQGDFPKTYDEVKALKGVGDYTAAAICSFAYDMPYAVVDGNVYRVLSRYFGLTTPIDSSQGKKEFASLAQKLLDADRPALYNQGIMDFGALQCRPKKPQCIDCPLSDSCMAYSNNCVSELPVKQGKVKVRDRYFNYFYIFDKSGAILLNHRTSNDIWKNMYDLPLIETTSLVDLSAILQQDSFLKKVVVVDISNVVLDYKHVLSHQRIHTNIYKLEVDTVEALAHKYVRISEKEIDDYPIPRLIHQFLVDILE